MKTFKEICNLSVRDYLKEIAIGKLTDKDILQNIIDKTNDIETVKNVFKKCIFRNFLLV